MSLVQSSYGKGNVRFLKVKKNPNNPNEQEVLQANVLVLLRGKAFDISYTQADNSTIIPTDTVKNTILVEAKTTDVWPIETFAAHLAKHFTSKYSWVEGLEIRIVQTKWSKYALSDGTIHPHSFRHDGAETRQTWLDYTKSTRKLTIKSSIKDLTVLKSTGSAFTGFNVCDYTILKPTDDRILSTDVDATWTYDPKVVTLEKALSPAGKALFDNTYKSARQVTLDLFALEQSASVQATMYNMSQEILAKVPEVAQVDYILPNNHYILFNLEWKGIKDNGDLYYPAPDPNGLIKSTVSRNGAKL